MKSRLLALLYPPKCIFCGALLEAEEGVCSRCGPKLPVTDDGSCAQEGDWFRSAFLPSFWRGRSGRPYTATNFSTRSSTVWF